MWIGAHVSIAGGMDKAFERGIALGANAIQVFTKNASQWKAREISEEEVARWKRAWKESGIGPVVAHDSYLINLASPDGAVRKKSVDAYQEELERCERLGIEALVLHPGSGKGEDPALAVQKVADALDEIHVRTRGLRVRTLLETMAGQGNTLGRRFEELAAIRERVSEPERVAICLDTCHIFASGYSFGSKREFDDLLADFDRALGLPLLAAIHVNDSANPLGSRKDRHMPIGEGEIGATPLSFFLAEKRLGKVPMLLETPEENHVSDLEKLKRMAGLGTARG